MKNKGVRLLAEGVTSCSVQSIAYGKCVASSYQDAHKNLCSKEFEAFKQCVQKVVKRKW
ncbi:unnamed protein product [Cunninghamella blakesleeana]